MALFGNLFRDKSRDDEFIKLCANGTVEQVKEALNSWGSLEAKASYENKDTPLMSACLNPDAGVVKLLLDEIEAKHDTNAINAVSPTTLWTPLHYAAYMGKKPEIVGLLVNYGAKLECKDKSGNTPLASALINNPNTEILKAFIKVGADIECPNEHGTILMAAIYISTQDVMPTLEHIKILIEAGADVNAFSQTDTPLMVAARNCKNPEVINMLLKAGANINTRAADGATALFMAAFNNPNPEIISVLIGAGAVDDPTKLIFASLNNPNPDILTALIKAGVKVEEAKTPMPLLFIVLDGLSQGKTTIGHVKALIDAGVAVNVIDEAGQTPLIFACQTCTNAELFNLLLDAGADINARDIDGHSALDWAVHDNNRTAVEILTAREAR